MKKILSIALTLTMLITLIILPTTASATTQNEENTYIATQDAYKNANGVAYMKGNTLRFKSSNGTDKALVTFERTGGVTFYMRGKTVYYGVEDFDGDSTTGIYSVNISGKNKTLITNKVSKILGGYGSTIITISGNTNIGETVYSVVNKNTKKLFKTSAKTITLFNGNIYYGNKVYNIANNKSTTFKNKGTVSSKTYMYYINSKNNLIRLDKAQKEITIAKGVTDVLYANNGKTVIYTKGDTYYRQTAKGKAYPLTTTNELQNKLMYSKDYDHTNKLSVRNIVMINKVVYFNANYDFNAIVSVGYKGGALKRVTGKYLDDPYIDSITGIDGNIYYTLVGTDDITMYSHKIKNVG
jgi:hypothetical protein